MPRPPKHKVSEDHRTFAKRLRTHQTLLKSRLWHELRGDRLDGWKFRRQVPLDIYVADFVCLAAKLIVEVDGPLHDAPEQKQKDATRDAVLRAQGFQILRFNEDVALGTVIASIRDALGASPSPGGRPRPTATLPHKGGGRARRLSRPSLP